MKSSFTAEAGDGFVGRLLHWIRARAIFYIWVLNREFPSWNSGIRQTPAEKPYSNDENLMHRSDEAGLLEDPDLAPPEDMFKLTRSIEDAPDTPERIVIRFKDAMAIEVEHLGDGTRVSEPVELLKYLNDLGGRHGIGRIDIVENRFVGIKSRGVYETPGATILHAALRDRQHRAALDVPSSGRRHGENLCQARHLA